MKNYFLLPILLLSISFHCQELDTEMEEISRITFPVYDNSASNDIIKEVITITEDFRIGKNKANVDITVDQLVLLLDKVDQETQNNNITQADADEIIDFILQLMRSLSQTQTLDSTEDVAMDDYETPYTYYEDVTDVAESEITFDNLDIPSFENPHANEIIEKFSQAFFAYPHSTEEDKLEQLEQSIEQYDELLVQLVVNDQISAWELQEILKFENNLKFALGNYIKEFPVSDEEIPSEKVNEDDNMEAKIEAAEQLALPEFDNIKANQMVVKLRNLVIDFAKAEDYMTAAKATDRINLGLKKLIEMVPAGQISQAEVDEILIFLKTLMITLNIPV